MADGYEHDGLPLWAADFKEPDEDDDIVQLGEGDEDLINEIPDPIEDEEEDTGWLEDDDVEELQQEKPNSDALCPNWGPEPDKLCLI